MSLVNKQTNYNLLMSMKELNDAYKEEHEGDSDIQPLFSENFEKFLETIKDEVESAGAQKNSQVANAIINKHLKGI